ncbi:hypothetical protein QFZ20_002237 [Flavobacterium sp. W4I14]|nr:hypothetical protein [Flavobacterium sp. W4I14]
MKSIKLFFVFLALFLYGCNEFIEPSLAERKLDLLAPSQGLETSSYQQTFWWEGMPDAIFYRLEVVTPKFDSISKLVLDTLITGNKFVYTLDPGRYEWRVRAENGSSASAFTTRAFTIYPSSLTDQILQVSKPTNGLYANHPEVQYEWLRLFGATQYRLQVDKNNFLDETKLLLNVTTDNLSFLQSLMTEGAFQYRIRAENATQNSKWSPVRNFTYDIIGPEKVTLSAPVNKQVVSRPVKLVWNGQADADRYQVYVYKSDSLTIYNTAYPQLLTATELNFNAGESGESLVWRVRAVDKAGNFGGYSAYYSFTMR